MSNYTGRITENRDAWSTPSGGQKAVTIKPGTYTFGPVEGDNRVSLTYGALKVWTRRDWVVDYKPVETTPDPPPTEPPDETDPDYILAGWNDGRTVRYVPE